MAYSNTDLISLEARIYAIEQYIKEHDPEGSWFLDQEFHKFLTVVAARRGSCEDFAHMLQQRQAHEKLCEDQGIELKRP